MIKYGLISETDARCLEKTIDIIALHNPGQVINITEIGIFDGQTARGLYEYTKSKQYGGLGENQDSPMQLFNYQCNYTAIDNNKDKEVLLPFPECRMIIGNSTEVYNQISDESQHLIFVDACHCFAHVVSDFFCYAPKVKVGGYMVWHDTGKHIKPFKDLQHGDKNNPDAYISVRKALEKLGLLNEWKRDPDEWELVFDEADEANEAGGVCIFKKLY